MLMITNIVSPERRISKAVRDVLGGLAKWELWTVLGWNDIRQRYRRSLLGPFWLTLSMGVMIGSIGFLYAKLFGQPVTDYVIYLTLGFISWTLISGVVLDSCTTFTASEGIIRQVRVPYSVHVFRMLWRNVIVFAHNIVIYFVVMGLFRFQPGATWVLAVPGFLLICLNGVWLGIVLGSLNARFRDLQQLAVNVMQIFFYLTPIVWKPAQLPDHPQVVYLNPIHHFIELLRMPLLGEVPSATNWVVAISITLAGYIVALFFLSRFRGRIAYWL